MYKLDKDLIVIYRQQSAEIAMGWLISPFTELEYDNLYRYNQETNSNKEVIRIKEFARRAKRAISGA